MFFEMFSEGCIVGAFEDVDESFYFCVGVGLVRGRFGVLFLARVFLSEGIEGPVNCLQSVAYIESLKLYFDVFVDPNFFEHCVQFLFDVDVIFETQFDFLFSFQDFLVLIFE